MDVKSNFCQQFPAKSTCTKLQPRTRYFLGFIGLYLCRCCLVLMTSQNTSPWRFVIYPLTSRLIKQSSLGRVLFPTGQNNWTLYWTTATLKSQQPGWHDSTSETQQKKLIYFEKGTWVRHSPGGSLTHVYQMSVNLVTTSWLWSGSWYVKFI